MGGGSERRASDERRGAGGSTERPPAALLSSTHELTASSERPSVLVAAADAEAIAARSALVPVLELRCDACDRPLVGEAAGSGLFLWWRGGELRVEEPPLCERCAVAIGVSAQLGFDGGDDEEG